MTLWHQWHELTTVGIVCLSWICLERCHKTFCIICTSWTSESFGSYDKRCSKEVNDGLRTKDHQSENTVSERLLCEKLVASSKMSCFRCREDKTICHVLPIFDPWLARWKGPLAAQTQRQKKWQQKVSKSNVWNHMKLHSHHDQLHIWKVHPFEGDCQVIHTPLKNR